MQTLPVIEHLNIFSNRIPSFRVMLEVSVPSQFVLQRTEEAFHRGVIVAIAFATHACHHAPVCEELLIESRAVLIALVAVMDESRSGPAALPGHPPGVRHDRKGLAGT